MCNLIKNEIRFCLQKKNILVFLLALLSLPFIFHFYYVESYVNYPNEIHAEMGLEADSADMYVSNIKTVIKNYTEAGMSADELVPYEDALKIWQNEQSYVGYIRALWKNAARPEYYEQIITQYYLRDENALNAIELENIPINYNTMLRNDRHDLENRIKLKKTYEENNIVQEVNVKKPTGAYVITDSFKEMGIVMLIVLLLVLIWNADIWTAEFDANAYQLLFTLPISRLRIYLTRIITRGIATFFALGVFFICFYGIGTLMYDNGFNNFIIINQTALTSWGFFDPTAIQSADAVYPLVSLIVYQTVLVFSYLFCFMAFINFSSILCKNKGLALMIPSIVLMVIYMVLNTSANSADFIYNPCSYILSYELLKGNIGVGFPLAVSILLGIGVVFYVGGYLTIRKDLQG